MTEESMALVELVEKHGDGDFLRELGQWTLQRLMELEAQVAAERDVMSEARAG